MTLQELYDNRNSIATQMRRTLDRPEAENRQLTGEERVLYNKLETSFGQQFRSTRRLAGKNYRYVWRTHFLPGL